MMSSSDVIFLFFCASWLCFFWEELAAVGHCWRVVPVLHLPLWSVNYSAPAPNTPRNVPSPVISDLPTANPNEYFSVGILLKLTVASRIPFLKVFQPLASLSLCPPITTIAPSPSPLPLASSYLTLESRVHYPLFSLSACPPFLGNLIHVLGFLLITHKYISVPKVPLMSLQIWVYSLSIKSPYRLLMISHINLKLISN